MIKDIEIPQGTMRFESNRPNVTTVTFIPHDDHPWLTNLRDMMKMLEGAIEIPHPNRYDLSGITLDGSLCEVCARAIEIRSQYYQHQRKQSQLQ